jgi:hypothetical protein
LATLIAIFDIPDSPFPEPELSTFGPIEPIYTSSLALSYTIDQNPSQTRGFGSKLQKSMNLAFSVGIPKSSLAKTNYQKPPKLSRNSLLTVRKQLCKRLILNENPKTPFASQYQKEILAYSEYLYSLQLYQKRARLLNLTTTIQKPECNLTVSLYCVCLVNRDKDCDKCFPKKSLVCPYCRIPCKGISSFCEVCMHGGHLACMKQWFIEEPDAGCVTGCGCFCLDSK